MVVKAGKNKARKTERQSELETEFTILLTKLFDISHADSEQMIRIRDDFLFLQDHRGDRKMIMADEGF